MVLERVLIAKHRHKAAHLVDCGKSTVVTLPEQLGHDVVLSKPRKSNEDEAKEDRKQHIVVKI